MIYDRESPFLSKLKLFKSKGKITCLHYGPYDNGHILVGTSTGDFFAFNSVDLKKMVNVKLAESPISSIAIEWTQVVLVGVRDGQSVIAISFIETKQKYVYMEIGKSKYATVVIDQKSGAKLK
jgi:hypothetical protein